MTKAKGSPEQPSDREILRIPDVRSHPEFDRLDDYQKASAIAAQETLNQAAIQGRIDLSRAKRILDFGAGTGGATWTLAKLAELNDGQVEAVDTNPNFTSKIPLADRLAVHTMDGITFLRDAAASGKRYDLITAFQIEPPADLMPGNLVDELLCRGQIVLATGGAIFITTEIKGLVRGMCTVNGLGYHEVGGAFIIPRQNPSIG